MYVQKYIFVCILIFKDHYTLNFLLNQFLITIKFGNGIFTKELRLCLYSFVLVYSIVYSNKVYKNLKNINLNLTNYFWI